MTAVLVAAVVTGAVTGQAGAQAPDVPPPSSEYGESGVRSGVVTVRAGSEWLPNGGGGGGGGGGSSCTTSSVDLAVADDFVQPVNQQWRVFGADGAIPFTASPTDLPSNLPTYMRHFSPTGRWFNVMCDGVIRILPEGGPAVTVAGLMQQALDQLDPPDPTLAVTPGEMHYTQLQSWLAVEPAYWIDRSATASAGRVVVTATATPYESIWDMGDGTEPVVCDGPGVVWSPGLDDDDTDCAHTYRRSSAGQPGDAFELTGSVHFEVTAATNAPGTYGPFDDLERETVEVVQVGEIQAVND